MFTQNVGTPSLALLLRIFIILSAITILCLTAGTNSLTCRCTDCELDFCETKVHRESSCFKSVRRFIIPENGTFGRDITYGCISGAEGSLNQLQCHVDTKKFKDPVYMKCCSDSDYCNDELPEPTKEDDPKWEEEPTLIYNDEEPFKIHKWAMILLVGVIILLVGSILLLILIIMRNFKTQTKSSNDERDFSQFLDSEIEKFADQHVVSSSVSTHSYSISNDLCQKPEPISMSDDCFVDPTSGIGQAMFNQRTMAMAVQGFGQTDHVGSGRFGRVFRGQYHGENVAVKAFRTTDQDSWAREDTIFRTLNHENIVRFIASEVTSASEATEIWMFLEFCPYGSLCDYLDHNEIKSPHQAVKILYSIINGLNYLHEDYALVSKLYKPSIAHRDIKSKNILMKTPDTCCIADFGHALIKLDENTLDYGKYRQLAVGTIRYMAPEILKPNFSLYNYKHFSTFAQADLYQYALVMWEVCHRTTMDVHLAGEHKLPYEGIVPQNPDIQDMIKIVCDDQYRPPRHDKWNKDSMMKHMSLLMLDCWSPNPTSRMMALGVKTRLRKVYDQVINTQDKQCPYNSFKNIILSPNFRNNDNSKASDLTL